MKAKNLALAGVAVLGAVALLGVFAVQANSPSESLVLASPTTKSQLFDYNLAQTYWPKRSENWKTIKRTSNADNDMLVRVVGGYNFGKYPNFCESHEYAASTAEDRSVDIIVGANNIQSFTFNFHFVMWGDISSYTFGYKTTVRWYEANYFNINDPDSSAPSKETKYTNDAKLVHDKPYSISWEKTSGSIKYRYLRAHFEFTCAEGSYPIVFLMDNFTVTWSC